MDIFSWGGLLQWCLLHFPSPPPEMYHASPESATRLLVKEAVPRKSVYLHPASESICPAEFLCQCLFLPKPGFYKGQTPHFFFPLKVIHFFYVAVTHRVSDSAKMVKWNELTMLSSAGQNTFLIAITLKVNLDHVIFQPPTSTAIAWIPPNPLFYEDVNSHPSNHLLLSVCTPPPPPRWKTRDSEMESLEDKELAFPGVTG